ncbi:LysR family transcriptional regulator [Streptomyces sp. NPDC001508]|uniref:LysR family transcriptional regulator n=1 Tax=Streptomyces sp. NPDC001508 TaxID=3154656 RepID=UPI00331A9AA6
MDLRLLTALVAVNEAGSVTAAARELLIAQPALSRQLQQLEHQLGIALFDRRHRRLTLTAAGQQFVEAATAVLRSAEAARSLAESLAEGRLARVRMVASPTSAVDLVAPFLATLGSADPLITVEEAQYAEAIERLRSGYDLALVSAPPPRDLATREIAVVSIRAYVDSSHPFARADEVSLEELALHRLIMLDLSTQPRRIVDQAFAEAGLPNPDLIECSTPQVVQALAAAGRGIAVATDDPLFGLVPVNVRAPRGRLTVTVHAAWDPGHHAAHELDHLAKRVSDFRRERYAS